MSLEFRLPSYTQNFLPYLRTALRTLFGLLLIVQAQVVVAADATMDAEIDFLISEVARSECKFVRNGKEHSADDAVAHLQMKRRRGKRYFDTTEEFIERIASKSSWSGKEYVIRCPDQSAETAAQWFYRHLHRYREQVMPADG